MYLQYTLYIFLFERGYSFNNEDKCIKYMKDIISDNLNNIEYALKYPFSNEKSKYGSSIQGIASILLSPFLIPLFILIGYRIELIESVINDEDVPKFESYEDLFEEGITGLLVYLPIFTLMLLAVLFSLIGLPMLIGFFFVALYVWPATSILYAIKRDYKEVYSSDLIELTTNRNYMLTYIGMVILTIILLFLSTILSIVTLGIGFILLLPIYLYSRPVLWAYMYKQFE